MSLFVAGRAIELLDLQTMDLFLGIDPDLLGPLAAQMVEVRVPRDHQVISEGDHGLLFYIVSAGTFTAYHEQPGQPTLPLRQLTKGDFFGELAVVGDQGRYGVSVRAAEDGRLIQVQRHHLEDFLAQQPVARLKLQGAAARRHSHAVAGSLELGRRREVRILCRQRVSIELDDGRRRSMELENLSLGGVCLGPAPAGWRVGSEVSFGLVATANSLPLRGEVCWRHKDTVGIAFRPQSADHDKLLQMAIRLLLESTG